MRNLVKLKSRVRAGLACGLYLAARLIGYRRLVPGQTKVIVFHHLDDMPRFEAILARLQREYHLISFQDYLDGKRAADRLNIIIACDDGYASWAQLLPLMARYHFAPLLFINSDFMGLPPEGAYAYCRNTIGTWPDQALDWDSLKALAAAGAEIGGHSAGHINLATCTDPAQSAAAIADDRNCITHRLGQAPRAFAYPFGLYTPASIAQLQTAGYSYGFTSDPGTLDESNSSYLLKRINVGLRPPLIACALIEGWGEVITTLMARLKGRRAKQHTGQGYETP